MTYLGVGPGKTHQELNDTRGYDVMFSFLIDLYKDHLVATLDADGDDIHFAYHRVCALRLYFFILIDTSIFVDKSVTCVSVIYLRYFIDLKMIHEYN